MEIDPGAYDTLGERLPTDPRQSRLMIFAMILGAIAAVLVRLWAIYTPDL
jgi:hypothetical protein